MPPRTLGLCIPVDAHANPTASGAADSAMRRRDLDSPLSSPTQRFIVGPPYLTAGAGAGGPPYFTAGTVGSGAGAGAGSAVSAGGAFVSGGGADGPPYFVATGPGHPSVAPPTPTSADRLPANPSNHSVLRDRFAMPEASHNTLPPSPALCS